MKLQGILLWIFFICSVLLLSCIKKEDYNFDFSKISDSLVYKGIFLMPIGHQYLTINSLNPISPALYDTNQNTSLPWWGKVKHIQLSDTIPFNASKYYIDSTKIAYLIFRLVSNNLFPTSFKTQVYFLDIGNHSIDSLFELASAEIVEPAIIDGNGSIVKSGFKITDIPVERNKIRTINQTRFIRIKNIIENQPADTSLLKFYPTYSLSIKLSMEVAFDCNINQF
jgi:hypothetical protein